MATQIVIPNVGESVTSGVISSWSVPDGAFVERDQTVLELETDKVTMEVPDPSARLKPGMFGRFNITWDARRDALLVPREAVVDAETGDDAVEPVLWRHREQRL